MPNLSLSDAIQEAYASAPADIVTLHTIEIRHPSFNQPIRLVRDKTNLLAYLEDSAPENPGEQVEFIAFAFDLTLPEVQQAGSPEVEITIDNVTGEIVGYLDQASQSTSLIEVTYRPYLTSDLSTPQMDPPLTLVVRSISADVFRVKARAGYGDLSNRKFPNVIYDTENFPGLV